MLPLEEVAKEFGINLKWYELRLTSKARRDLRRLSANIQAQVFGKLEAVM